jgi:DNA-binding MarR family transcriptional regulator
MTNDAVKEQARYIFTTGKVIHDRILKIQANQLASDSCETFGELSVSQLHVVRLVRKHGTLAMSELAELLEVSPPSASTMVDRLVDKGVLSREHSTEDRRKVVVRISPEAIKKIESVETSVLQLFEGLVEKLGPETTRQWCRVLKEINAVLSDGLQDSNRL